MPRQTGPPGRFSASFIVLVLVLVVVLDLLVRAADQRRRLS